MLYKGRATLEVTLDAELDGQLRECAGRLGLTTSEALVEALVKYVERHAGRSERDRDVRAFAQRFYAENQELMAALADR